MDLESIYRLGLSNIGSIDLANSDERYYSSTNNHIIDLYLIKEHVIACPYCGMVNDSTIKNLEPLLLETPYHLKNNIIYSKIKTFKLE